MGSRKREFEDIARRDGERLPTSAANQPSVREKANVSVAKLRTLSVFRLQPHPLQPPERHSEENVADLLVSILELGLQNPPHAWQKPDGTLVILFGHRRTRAWQLGALEGRLPEKIRVFVRTDLDEGEDVKLMAAEYSHWKEFSTMHLAQIVGAASRYLSLDREDEISIRKLAAVLPWEKTQTRDYLTIYRALQDPRLAPAVRRADSAPIALLCKMLAQDEFSTRLAALEAYGAEGAAAAEGIIRSAKPAKKGGRPLKTVTRTSRGDGLDLTVRIRPTMTASEIEEAREALMQGLEDLKLIPRQPGETTDE